MSDFLAYGYRSEGCASWASPLKPFIFFLIFSLSAQYVRHFAPISSNLGSGPTKLTLKIFWNFFFKKKSSLLVLNDRSKYPLRHSFYKKTSSFPLPEWLFSKKKIVFCCFWWFFFVPCVSFSGIWVQVRGLCLLSQPSDTLYFFLICSLSAQCVRHFAPISSNLGSGPTKLTLVFFWNFFFRKKNSF